MPEPESRRHILKPETCSWIMAWERCWCCTLRAVLIPGIAHPFGIADSVPFAVDEAHIREGLICSSSPRGCGKRLTEPSLSCPESKENVSFMSARNGTRLAGRRYQRLRAKAYLRTRIRTDTQMAAALPCTQRDFASKLTEEDVSHRKQSGKKAAYAAAYGQAFLKPLPAYFRCGADSCGRRSACDKGQFHTGTAGGGRTHSKPCQYAFPYTGFPR